MLLLHDMFSFFPGTLSPFTDSFIHQVSVLPHWFIPSLLPLHPVGTSNSDTSLIKLTPKWPIHPKFQVGEWQFWRFWHDYGWQYGSLRAGAAIICLMCDPSGRRSIQICTWDSSLPGTWKVQGRLIWHSLGADRSYKCNGCHRSLVSHMQPHRPW